MQNLSLTVKFVLPLLLLLCLWSSSPVVKAGPEGYWLTAYEVAWAYNDDDGFPHYGAFFGGINGNAQYFNGPSGAPSDYNTWDWWGNDHNVLLLTKTWLFAPACWSGMTPSICFDRWNGVYHHAFMQ